MPGAKKTSSYFDLNLDPQRSIETVIRRTTAQPFRFKFSMFYIAIVGIVAYINGVSSCSRSIFTSTPTAVGVILLTLFGIEWFEQSRFNRSFSRRTALLLLLARLVLIEGLNMLDCAGIALLLIPMIPYSAHFIFGTLVSTLLSLAYILIVFWRTSLPGSFFYLESGPTSNLLAFTFVMLFVPLIGNIIRRDDNNRRRTEQLLIDLESSHRKLQAYTEQVAELAAAEERNRLARDIHDSLGHYLTAVNIQLEKALAYQERDPVEAKQALRDAKQAAADALRDVRLSVTTLRNVESTFSLATSLGNLVEGACNDHLQVNLTVHGDEIGYPRSKLMTLYRAAQEGLTNIQKHAQASQADLLLELDGTEAKMTLHDNGIGFDPETLESASSTLQPGYGLRGMRERLELVGGKVTLSSTPQAGTDLTVVVPKNPSIVDTVPESEGSW